jgi:cell division protein FtsN
MDTEKRPVLTGLVALVGVAVVIGLLGGLAVTVGVKATGIGGSSSAGASDETPATFELPRPSDTSTVTPPEETAQVPGEEPSSEAPDTGISLTAPQQSVGAMQQIDLTGTYPGGEGAVLQVQRFENEQWTDFPVTMSVSGGTFATYVQTGRTGPNKWRVVDTDSDVVSNEVTVTVG